MKHAKSHDDQLREAADPATPGDRLKELAFKEKDLRAVVLQNPACPNDLLHGSLAAGEPHGWNNPGLELFFLMCKVPMETIHAWANRFLVLPPDTRLSPFAKRLFHQIQQERLAASREFIRRQAEAAKIHGSSFQIAGRHTATYGWSVATLELPVAFEPHVLVLAVPGQQIGYEALRGTTITEIHLSGRHLLNEGKRGQHAASFLENGGYVPPRLAPIPGEPAHGQPGDKITVRFSNQASEPVGLVLCVRGRQMP